MSKIEKEKRTVELMIEIYCRGQKHQPITSRNEYVALCEDCAKLRDYAHERLSHCRFGENKTKCKVCPVHCYNPEMREAIRKVMRYSGPRMMLYHPLRTIMHMFSK